MPFQVALDYARHFGLAVDHLASDPFHLLDLGQSSIGLKSFNDEFHNIQEDLQRLIPANNESVKQAKLQITTETSRYLLNAVSRPQVSIDALWPHLLLRPSTPRQSKLDLPILSIGGGDVQKDINGVRKGLDLRLLLEDMKEDHEENIASWSQRDEQADRLWRQMLEQMRHVFKDAIIHEKSRVSPQTIRKLIKMMTDKVKLLDIEQAMNQDLCSGKAMNQIWTGSLVEWEDFPVHDSHFEELQEMDESNPQPLYKGKCVRKNPFDDIDDWINLKSDPEEDEWLINAIASEEMQGLLPTANSTDSEFRVEPERTQDSFGVSQDETCCTRYVESGGKRRKIGEKPTVELSPPTRVPEQSTSRTFLFKKENMICDEPTAQLPFVGEEPRSDTQQECNTLIENMPPMVNDTSEDIAVAKNILPSKIERLHLPLVTGYRLEQERERIGRNLIPFLLLADLKLLPFNMEVQNKMNWTAVPYVTNKEVMCENVETQNSYLEKASSRHDSIVQSFQMLWKQPGARIFDETDDDDTFSITEMDGEEPEVDSEPQSKHWNTPSQPMPSSSTHTSTSTFPLKTIYKHDKPKRMQNCKAPMLQLPDMQQPKTDFCGLPGSRVVMNNRPDATEVIPFETPYCAGKFEKPEIQQRRKMFDTDNIPSGGAHASSNVLENSFSASTALTSFLDLRGKKFIRPKPGGKSSGFEPNQDPIEFTQEDAKNKNDLRACSSVEIPRAPERANIPLGAIALPKQKGLDGKRAIIVNSDLVQSHPKLAHFLEANSLGCLTIVYRDTGSRSLVPDVILGPMTCLIISTLQALSQRPLPGADNCDRLSMVHSRILELAVSYQQVVVLITYLTPSEEHMATKNVTQIAAFAAFCSSFELHDTTTEVRPYWIPCIDAMTVVDATNAWTWRIIESHAFSINQFPKLITASCSATSLIQDETLWELFLRRAGLNVYAAQVILGAVKKPDAVNENSDGAIQPSMWGLPLFVRMDRRRRIELFGSTVGIPAIERVNCVLDHLIQKP